VGGETAGIVAPRLWWFTRLSLLVGCLRCLRWVRMASCTSVDAAVASGRALRARFVSIQFTPGTVSVFTPSCELVPFAS
jgi:hypothetical protein